MMSQVVSHPDFIFYMPLNYICLSFPSLVIPLGEQSAIKLMLP